MSTPFPRHNRRERRRRSGNATLLVVMLLVLIGFVALALDIGAYRLARVELQAGTDAIVLAGVARIDGTPQGLVAAEQSALAIAQSNIVQGTAIDLDPASLVFGIYEDGVFTPSADAEEINALGVEHTRTGVQTPFAAVSFGIASLSVTGVSVAAVPKGPVGSLECYIPLSIPFCTYEEIRDGGQQSHHFQFSSDGSDTIGWADPYNPNASSIRDAFDRMLTDDCESDGEPSIGVDDDIILNNGVTKSNIVYVGRTLSDSPDPWDDELWGARPPRDAQSVYAPSEYAQLGVLAGPIPLFDNGGDCTDVKWTQPHPIKGFTWAVIFDVYDGAGDHKGFQMYIDPDHEFEVPGSGGIGGTGNIIGQGPPLLTQ